MDSFQQMRILDGNLSWLGYSVIEAMELAGKGLAAEIEKALETSRAENGKNAGRKGSESGKSGSGRETKSKGKKGGKAKIAFFCGPGNKGGDGFVAARHLSNKHEVTVFITAEPKTKEAATNLEKLKGKTKTAKDAHKAKLCGMLANASSICGILQTRRVCMTPKTLARFQGKAKNTKEETRVKIRRIESGKGLPKEKFDVYVDSLLGTGLSGELREPYSSIVKWLNKQRGIKVATDVPTGFGTKVYFKDDVTVSMHCAKKKNAKVVDVGIPKSFESKIRPGQVKALRLHSGQHKGMNGVLTVIGGSKKYHGAPLYAIEAAAPFVDLIYFYSPEKDNLVLLKMKSKSNAFITTERKDLLKAVEKSDCILIGNGLEENKANKRLVNSLLKKFPSKKFVLDAGAMMLADKRFFKNRVVLTPHAGEFTRCFGGKKGGSTERTKPKQFIVSPEEAKRQAKKHGCIILLKGPIDHATDGFRIMENTTGNVGMTRGGTGDVLAGLAAALSCQNELFLSAQAAAFLNGLAGDLVALTTKAYTADDLAAKLPEAYSFAIDV
ncbi:NAD(P)H-hydrate dehydratase [Candidatus Micrarchaeota archaeon]|nr:NAD(P)H-hydrate dehydratase [Candidatus Micrarchaeota archaeon]